MRALVLALLAPLAGCTLILGDVDRRECRFDADCPGAERCTVAGRCVAFVEPDARIHADAAPDPEPDVGIDAELDATTDAEADAGDAGPDAAVDAGTDAIAPFGDGDCFGDAVQGAFTPVAPPPGPLHVPQVDCTPWARLWTAERDDGLVFAWDADGDGEAEGQLPMAIGGRFAADGDQVALPRPNPGEPGMPDNIWRVDLRTGEGLFVVPGLARQREPVRAPGRTAFIARGTGGVDGVVVHLDGVDEYSECGQPDRRQWGVAAGPGWTAWFEQRLGSRRPRLVVVGETCDDGAPRRERLLAREIGEETRLHATDDGVVWLQASEDGRNNLIWRWRFRVAGAEPAALGPVGLDGNPVELVARGHRAAVVTYLPGRNPLFDLDLVDLDRLALRLVGQEGDARRPALSGRYVLWADKGNLQDLWSLRYERLEE
ncbi:MAG: hypothetical protein H6705_04695 [Myxococcales bacterium]|nr:hypothetical protein [Myxococcales bacterium]